MTLSEKTTAVIWAKDTTGAFYSVADINPAVNDDATAANQLNKLFAAVGKTIVADGLQLLITKEAI